MKREILQIGNPILRIRAKPLSIEEIQSPSTHELIEAMRATLDTGGVALAAPQIGEPIQLIVVEDRCRNPHDLQAERFREQERVPVPFHAIINPIITGYEGSDLSFFEACLSVRDHLAVVPRSRSLEVECLDETGSLRRIRATGWYARILQHEIDHLNGILYVDRMNSRTFMTKEMYQRFWVERSVQEALAALDGASGCTHSA